jgi:hypothetical protein
LQFNYRIWTKWKTWMSDWYNWVEWTTDTVFIDYCLCLSWSTSRTVHKKWDLFYQYIEALSLFIENQIIYKIWNLQFLSLECRSNCAVLQVLQIISIKSVSYQLMLPKAYFQIFRFRLSEKKLKTFKIKELKKLKKIKRKLSAGVFVINKH